ncbi:hypothetical protein FHG87_004154 [Trinorchestia longiramus]|nr:hypothetical protein FHG87_004154 [Trinorchestia longiramus]
MGVSMGVLTAYPAPIIITFLSRADILARVAIETGELFSFIEKKNTSQVFRALKQRPKKNCQVNLKALT